MSVSWSKEQRKIAKAERKALICIAIDGRTADKPSGLIEFTAPADADTVRRVEELLRDIVVDRMAKLKRRKERKQ